MQLYDAIDEVLIDDSITWKIFCISDNHRLLNLIYVGIYTILYVPRPNISNESVQISWPHQENYITI